MAYDDRNPEGRFRDRGRGRWRGDLERDDGPETQWRGDPSFGGGWGNQLPRPQRFGDRSWRGADDPWADAERYGGDYGPFGRDSELDHGGPGFDASYGGPRFDRAEFGSTASHGFAAGSARSHANSPRHDLQYSQWRSRQIAELDQDYDEYRRENQSRFEREFGAWRERRGAQRQAVGRAAVHMEVVGSDGAHVGTVDGTNGDDIVLTRSDPNAGGIHHRIPCGWVDRVEDQVILNLTAEEATARWREDSRSRALFERPNSAASGPHMLNRSFAGTYPDKK
jgi:hypothetical protein